MATKRRMAGAPARKSKASARNGDEYLAALAEPARTTLTALRASIRTLVPEGTTETMSYGMPVFVLDGRALLWFGAFARHCSLFVGTATVRALENELGTLKAFKGTIQFPHDAPPSPALLRRIVRTRLALR